MTFPWIAEGVNDKKIQLHGWYFDMTSGRLLEHNAATDLFEDVAAEKKKAPR